MDLPPIQHRPDTNPAWIITHPGGPASTGYHLAMVHRTDLKHISEKLPSCPARRQRSPALLLVCTVSHRWYAAGLASVHVTVSGGHQFVAITDRICCHHCNLLPSLTVRGGHQFVAILDCGAVAPSASPWHTPGDAFQCQPMAHTLSDGTWCWHPVPAHGTLTQ